VNGNLLIYRAPEMGNTEFHFLALYPAFWVLDFFHFMELYVVLIISFVLLNLRKVLFYVAYGNVWEYFMVQILCLMVRSWHFCRNLAKVRKGFFYYVSQYMCE